MKVLVTGASGRLGPFVVSELEQAGHQLALLSRTRPEAAERWPWIEGDIANFDACMKAAKGMDAIQHLAAEPSPSDHPGEERDKPFDQTIKSNVLGTYYLLQAALKNKIGIFVMTGSNCALGHGYRISKRQFPYKYLPVDENHPCDVEDSYSYSKLAGEELLASYTRAYGIRTYALRAAGICPPARRKKMAENAGPANGWNEWLWAWVGSEDVASAHRLLMEKAHQIDPHGVYFCNGNDTTALEPTHKLIEKFRPDLLGIFKSQYEHASLLSNEKLRKAVGWVHATSWRDLRES